MCRYGNVRSHNTQHTTYGGDRAAVPCNNRSAIVRGRSSRRHTVAHTAAKMAADRRMAYESYRKRAEIPRGLDYLADRLVRAVVQVQPENVRQFAAEFFDGLLRQRDRREYRRTQWHTVADTCHRRLGGVDGGGSGYSIKYLIL